LNDSHASASSIEHDSICTRCKDVDIDACCANIAMVESLKAKATKL
jgi:hypothetical protein